jgi:hypothetical protein
VTPHQILVELFSAYHLQIAALKILRKMGQKTVYYFELHGSQALAMWEDLRDVVDQSGYWPVLLGSGPELDYLHESFRLHAEPEPIYGEGFVMRSASSIESLARLTATAGLAWLEQEREFRLNDGGPLLHGDWPGDVTPLNRISSIYDYRTDKPYSELYMALVPSPESWLVPAYLSFGGWNECPPADIHASLFKYWYDIYGAEVIALTHDTVEMRVRMPPTSRETALKLAEEQFVYCSEMDSGGTVEDLAAQLLNASVWSFWWD